MAGPADSSSTETTAEVPEIGRFGLPRSGPLILLATIATLFFIDWAQPVLVPIVLALLVSYALSRRRITIQVMDAIRSQIQRYLAVQVATSAIVGVASGLAFWAVGLENAAAWGVVAGVLNLVPYVGAIVTTAGTALVAFFQFGTIGMALAVASISVVISVLEGWLTPWLASRASRMNAVVVFSGLLFWGWLWGAWGLLLGLPILMVVKAVCDHVEDLKPIGEFMGERPG